MYRKRSKDDEIPLTVPKSTILQETKARFDTLLKAALSHEDEVESKIGKKGKKASTKGDLLVDIGQFKKRARKTLTSSTQELVSDGESSITSTEQEESPSKASPSVSQSEVKDITSVSSCDELLQSPLLGKPLSSNVDKMTKKVHSNDSITSSSPNREAPTPRRRHSTRDESRETTSSRVSSPDSVMTAIEAASPTRSIKSSSPSKSSVKGDNQQYELKPLKAFSASYEEIDETSLDHNEPGHIPEGQSLKGMENAASYEEILEDSQTIDVPDRPDSGSNQRMPHESLHNERKSRQNKVTRLQMSFRNRKLKHEVDYTDTSSNDRAQIPTKHKRQVQSRKKGKASAGNEVKQQIDLNYTYEKIVGITLHRCDTLKIDSLIQHPMVRVHILDTISGEYLKKSQPDRSVSFFQENPNIDNIQPLTTQPCNFSDPRSLTPIWEETLVFNEDIKYILAQSSSILILFEILDCVSFDTAIAHYQKLGVESGWHRIAWAFLKPCGPNNTFNIDKRLRLQLYKPRFDKNYRSRSDCDKCDVYRWWTKGGWIQYPSTLHVTVHSLPMPTDIAPTLRSYFALQPEQGVTTYNLSDETPDIAQDESIIRGLASINSATNEVMWSRLPSQSCKIPNEKKIDISAGHSGSFSLKFSHKGHFLAVTADYKSLHNIYVYKITDGSELVRFRGHPGLIYSLEWSPSDDLLLSASADCTACIWSLKDHNFSPLQMLPHPSFVYSAVFLPSNPPSLATACCDHVIRIWRQRNLTSPFELQQELSGHEGYVSTMCVNSSGTLYSGDSNGQIRVWENRDDGIYSYLRTLNIRELQGVILSHLVLHPGQKRLLVLARDSLLRMIDISTGVAIQWFKGALNQRINSKACISPCGSFVFSPSEDGTCYVWNADTGLLIASYTGIFHNTQNIYSQEGSTHQSQLLTSILSSAVDYHPFEHMAAFAVYGVHAPVIVCSYQRESSSKDIGLQMKNSSILGLKDTRPGKENNSLANSAFLVSSIKAQITSKQGDYVNQNKNSHDKAASFSISNQVSGRSHKQESHHLSYVIKQLDYVLQLSRASKQEQEDSVKPQVDRSKSPALSHDSTLQVLGSPFHYQEEAKSFNVNKEGNEIADSSISEYQLSKPGEVTHDLYNKGGLLSHRVSGTVPVEVHFIQEKQPPRPAPRLKRSVKAEAESRPSPADVSTTDTSLLSSENEDVNPIQIKPQSKALKVHQDRELSYSHQRNQKLTALDKSQVVDSNQLVSFDSDSDEQLVKE